MYTNGNTIIYAAAYLCFFCVYKNPTFFTFQIFASTMTPSCVLFFNFVKFQNQSFHIQKGTEMNLYYRFVQ